MNIKIVSGLTSLLAILATGCNSADKVALDFCKGHTSAPIEQAYRLFSQQDQIELSLNGYRDFTWDQRTFDLRILQGHDICGATVKRLNDEQALATLNISRNGVDQPFSCLLPMAKEDGEWRVIAHWTAASDYYETRTRLRQELPLRYQDMANLDNEKYLAAAPEPLQNYFDKISKMSTRLKNSLGGSSVPFCFGRLNPDGGQEMAFNYLIFEGKLAAIPSDWQNQKQNYSRYLTDLQKGYTPISTIIHRGVRMDLVTAEVIRQKDDSGRASVHIQYRFLFWGQVHGPLSWQLAIYDKSGEQVQEGFGKEAELITDFPQFIADAPDLTMAVINLPKLPNYTNKVVLTFIEPDQMTKYQIELPLRPDYLESGRK